MIYSILGLILDLIGVLLLFKYGILPDKLWQHILMDNGISEKNERKHKLWSKIAIAFVSIGFLLQLTGSIIQSHYSDTIIKNIDSETINLGTDKNQTTNITGTLKIKFENNKLYYQIQLKGSLKKISLIDSFVINFEDKDGFNISEIKIPNSNDNNDLSTLIENGNAILHIKSDLNFESKDFQTIKKWKLTVIQK
jgi:hypothetical protein